MCILIMTWTILSPLSLLQYVLDVSDRAVSVLTGKPLAAKQNKITVAFFEAYSVSSGQ